jgi:uncharacterized membrane protein YdjX (TVP38/TMEM64 family)
MGGMVGGRLCSCQPEARGAARQSRVSIIPQASAAKAGHRGGGLQSLYLGSAKTDKPSLRIPVDASFCAGHACATCPVRLLRVSIVLAVLLSIPFFVWGETFGLWFSGEAGVNWIRGWGAWGGLATICLLVADLFLPVPSTAVMSAAGFLYGSVVGGLLSAAGSFLSGILAYGLSRAFGRALAGRLADSAELANNAALFEQKGPWLIVLSRWLPLLPEVSCCLAGLAKMRFSTFCVALACGCIPVGFCFAAIGHAGQERPGFAVVLSVITPAVLWFVARALMRRASSA